MYEYLCLYCVSKKKIVYHKNLLNRFKTNERANSLPSTPELHRLAPIFQLSIAIL
jgi:hypothetical protein